MDLNIVCEHDAVWINCETCKEYELEMAELMDRFAIGIVRERHSFWMDKL